MRSQNGVWVSPNFLLQKKIEDWFSEKHPDKWIPLYSMVTFSHMGYHQAMLKGKLQDVIMNDIMIKNNLFDDFDINVFVFVKVSFLPKVIILSACGFKTFAFGNVVVICSYLIKEFSIFLNNAFLCSDVLFNFL